MMVQKFCIVNYRSIASRSLHKVVRNLSAQSAVNFKVNDDEYSKARPFEEIPGLSKFQIIRRFSPGGMYHNMPMLDVQASMRTEFGNFYIMPGMFGRKATLTTFNPEDVEWVHRNEGANPFRRGLESMAHFRKNIRDDVYSVGGLIIEQGEEWHKMRQAVNPILMKPQTVSSYIPLIDSIVNDFMKNIPLIQNEEGEMPADFSEYVNLWSLESIAAIALEKRFGLMNFKKKSEEGMKIARAVRKILLLSIDYEVKPSIWRYYETKGFKELLQAYDDLTELTSNIIDEAKQRYEAGQYSSDQEESVLFKLLQKDKRYAVVMAFDMIFAGIDATSSAFAFTLYCLAKNPEKQEKLRKELNEILPNMNTPLNEENMKSLLYLRAVIKETLRMYPPAFANMRRTTENIVIQGYQVPKGVDVIMSMQQIYIDSFENPEQFVPERWLRNPSEADVCPHSMKQSHPFSYLPFGYGVRFCVGKRIAEMELEVFISRLLRNYKIEWHHEDMKIKAAAVNLPDSDLKFKFIKISVLIYTSTMQSQKVFLVNFRKCESSRYLKATRSLSAQAAVNFKPKDDEYSKARPYEEIPGLSKFELIKRFIVPGGKFHNKSLLEIQKSMIQEFGNFYKMPGVFGQNTMLMTYDPDTVEFVHRNEGIWPYRRSLATMKHFRENLRSDVYSVGGLIVEQGEDWYKMRQAINPIMMKPRIVSSYIPLIDSIVQDFMPNISELQDDKGVMPANFSEYLNAWSLESITAISLEKRLGLMDFKNQNEEGKKIARAIRKIFVLGLEYEMKPSIWRYFETKTFKELIQAYDDLTELSLSIIEEAKQRYEVSSLPKDENESVLSKLLQKDKRYATVMAFDMIFGGVDTTTSALAFSLYCLATNPEKQEKLRKELIQIMPNKDTPLNGENMKNLPYLRAVLKETLRIFPPAGANMRRTAENLVIQGYQVPKGVDIMLGMLQIYKDPSSFGNPEQFVPERWLRNPSEADVCPHSMKQSHPFAFLPFGYGVRFCAGKRIAEMELEVFISRLMRNYKVEWEGEEMKIRSTLVNLPDADLKFKFTKL